MIALANFAAEKGYAELTGALANSAAQYGLERATFAALHLEAILNGPEPGQVIVQYQQIVAADKAFFKSNEAIVQALIAIAYHARQKPDAVIAKRDRDIGDRYLTEFLKSKDLGPEAYRSVGRHLRAIRAGDWKLVALKGGGWELYDLSRDRGEQRNLAAAQPAKVRELEALWKRQMETSTALALTDPPPPEAPKKGKGAKGRKSGEL